MRPSLNCQKAFASCPWYIFFQDWLDFVKAVDQNISGVGSDETVLRELWERWTPNIYRKIEKGARVPSDSFHHTTKGCVWIQIINLFSRNLDWHQMFCLVAILNTPSVRGLERHNLQLLTWPILREIITRALIGQSHMVIVPVNSCKNACLLNY